VNSLLGLAVDGMLVTPLAILVNFHSTGIVAAILLGGIVSLLAVIASKGDHRANIFLF